MHDQHGLESPSRLSVLREEESSGEKRLPGITVPMAIAGQAGRHRYQRILHPRCSLPLRADMFEEQQGATRLEHAPNLPQTALRITYGTEDECCHHAVEKRVGKREVLDRSTRERDGMGASASLRRATTSMASSGSVASTRTTRSAS